MRLVLTGFMGSGKTTVGREVAARLGWTFIDLDEQIEQATGSTVREIFESSGELAFRALEREALHRALEFDPLVLAAGGGTLTDPANLRAAAAGAIVAWLHPTFATIVQRVGGRGKEDRPMFRDEESALSLYRQRLPAYATADLTFEIAASESAAEVASRIVHRLRERGCTT